MMSDVFCQFLTSLTTFSYSITSDLGGYIGPLPTLISDIIDRRSLSETEILTGYYLLLCQDEKKTNRYL